VNSRIRILALVAALGSLVAAAVVNSARACSHCMCGMPFPAGVPGGVVPMQMTYGLEDRYLSKTG
jgi:hypothetical protein